MSLDHVDHRNNRVGGGQQVGKRVGAKVLLGFVISDVIASRRVRRREAD